MTLANMYTRRFSKIGEGIQKKKIVWYGICSRADRGTLSYGIQILSYSGGNFEREIVFDITSNKEFVKDLVKYLYENSADVISFKDIINDLI